MPSSIISISPALSLVILALTTWRVSSLFVYEDGPKDLFGRIRYFVGVRYNEHNKPYATNNLAELFLCMWCFSPYAGATLLVLWFLFPSIILLYLPLAFSAVTIMIEGFFVVRD